MRRLWHTLLALGGEYGPSIQQYVAGDLLVGTDLRIPTPEGSGS